MASPFRTCSPSPTNRPSKANANSGLRKSFNANVLPKASASRNGNQAPTNSPADYPQRTSPFKDFNSPAWQSEEIGLENVRQCPPKSASAKSPASKGVKNFMSPTFSAASKAAASKKRVLAERNESVGVSQLPAKVPSDFANTHFMDLPASREPVMEDIYMKENEEAPRDIMEVDFIGSLTQTKNQTKKDIRRALYQVPVSGIDTDSLSFLSQFPDPGEERATALPPYDPKKNYLSPRPDFLRYRPNRGLDIDIIEDDEGFGKCGLFKSETPSERRVTESKEVESLGERMDAVGISSEDLDHRETQKEIQIELVSDGNFEPKKLGTPSENGVTETKEDESMAEEIDTSGISSEYLDHGKAHEGLQVKVASAGNPESHGLEFDSKTNAPVEVEETEDDSDDSDEEEHKHGFRWLRNSLLFGFVLLVSSVALLSSGSPGLLPPSLHDNVLARGEFYASAVRIAKNVVVIWRRDSVKNAGYSLLGYSRMKYRIVEKNVKSWFDSSSNNIGMRIQSSVKDGLQNSFENSNTGDIEDTGGCLDAEIDAVDDIESATLISELLVDSMGKEDLKEKQSSTETALEALDAILVKDVSQIPSVDTSIHLNGQVNVDYDDLHQNPELFFPSDLLDDGSSMEVYDLPDGGNSMEVYDLPDGGSSMEVYDLPDGESIMEVYDLLDGEGSMEVYEDEELVLQNGQGDLDDDALLENPELFFLSDLQDEENSGEEHESGDFVAHLEEPFSFYPDIEEANAAVGRMEGSWSEIQSIEAKNVAEHASKEQNVPEVSETIQISDPSEIMPFIIEDSEISGEDVLNKQSRPSMVPSDEYQAPHASQLEENDKSLLEDTESTQSNEPKESSLHAGEDSKGYEVQTSVIPGRNPRGFIPIGTRAVLSILVASVIAAIYFFYTYGKRSKISHDVVADKPTVEFFAKKEIQKENLPALDRMERAYSPMHFSASRNFPQVQLLAEYRPEEVSSSDKNVSRINAQEKSAQMYERRFRKGNIFSYDTQQDSAGTSEISPESLSYGSFTTYEKIARREGGGDKDVKVVTPVRRSNRIRKQATSP